MSEKNKYILADSDTLRHIRTSTNPTPAEEFAANDLKTHLRVMTGQPVVNRNMASGGTIYLNDRNAAESAGINPDKLNLSGDAFHLQTCGADLHLLSANDRGILYAASEILRILGARWYTPSINCIPRLSIAAVPTLNQTFRPAFEYRDMIAEDCADPEFLMRLRMNGHFSRVPGYLGGHMAYGMFVHTFYRLVPPKVYFAKHPEYFSMVKGKRVGEGAQLCLSNPDVIRIAAENILKAAKANPDSKIFSVSQNDWGGACECPNCRKIVKEEGSESGPVLRFANAIADIVAKRRPDILISTLAYTYTLDAPKKAVPRPNVRVRLCPISCCSGHPFGTCDDEKTKRFLNAFKKWSTRMSQMYIWHYSIDFSYYALPIPNFDELEGNIRFYRKNGVYGVFIQDMGPGGFGAESADLRGFLQSELLWNPQKDVWPLVNEWVSAVHGKAAPFVMRYYTLFHEYVRKNRHIHPVCYAKPDHPLYNKKLLAKADSALAQGEKIASGFSKKRIQILRAGLKLPHLHACGGVYAVKGNQFAGKSTAQDIRDINIIAKRWKEYGITHPGEGQSLPDAVNMWRSRVTPHRLTPLRSGGNTLAIAPMLGGRILTWRVHGRQWLAMPDPENKFQAYPFSGGYSETAIYGVHSFQGWKSEYQIKANSKQKATLEAKYESWDHNAVKMARAYTLSANTLTIDSKLETPDGKQHACRWDGCLQFDTPEWTWLDVPAINGTKRLIPKEIDDGFANATTIPVQPGGGKWRLHLPGYIITNTFTPEIAEIVVGINRKKNILSINVRSDVITLQEDQLFKTSQIISITKE